MKSEISNSKQRITWISILQAIAIIAIVIGHLDIDGDLNPNHPIANWIEQFMQFGLATFFFISGYLYVRSSQYDKSYPHLLKAKFIRLLIPYIFMTLVMLVIKNAMPSMMSRKAEYSFAYIVNAFLYPWDGPARHVWFLASLFSFFALIPLYKWTIQKKNSSIITIAILFLIQQLSSAIPYTSLLAIDRSVQFFIYFYLGMVMMKYNLISKLHNLYTFWACLLLYIVGSFYEIPLQTYWGIGMIISFSYLLSKRERKQMMSWYKNISKYSYQIYLMHFPPIFLGRMIFNKHFIHSDLLWFPICWISTLLIALYIPILICKIFEKLPKPIRLCIGL